MPGEHDTDSTVSVTISLKSPLLIRQEQQLYHFITSITCHDASLRYIAADPMTQYGRAADRPHGQTTRFEEPLNSVITENTFHFVDQAWYLHQLSYHTWKNGGSLEQVLLPALKPTTQKTQSPWLYHRYEGRRYAARRT
jgi:hypothetical protein